MKAEEVTIQVVKPTISTSSAQTGSTVSKEQMNLVPYGRGARNFEAVATSVPGVQSDAVGLQMNGTTGNETAYIIDGVMVNDPAVGTQGTTLLQDFVQEVDIKTGGYQAEYGRASGGVINVVTKSGGNDFHGSVFINWSPFEATRKQLSTAGLAIASQTSGRYNLDFGFEVGGPIIKDKLWFFAGFAPQLQSVNFDRIIQARKDDGTGRAVIDPATGNPATTEIKRQTYTNTETSYQFTGKLTYLVNENHSVAVALYGNPTTSTGAQVVGSRNEGASLFGEQNGSTDVTLRYQGKLFNKSMLVEASTAYHYQFGGGRFPTTLFVDVQGKTAAQLRDTPAMTWRQIHNLLDPLLDDGTVPASQKSSEVLAACAIQANGFNPCPVNNYRTGGLSAISNSTLSRLAFGLKLSNFLELAGHHLFKYGVDYAQDKYSIDKFYTGGGAWEARGTPVATSYFGTRGYGHVDPQSPGVPEFDASRPGHLKGDEVTTATKNVTYAVFAQDTWNIMDKVVLDIGIRGEAQKMYADVNSLDVNGNAVSGPGIDLFNVMPRIGLIYDWTGRGLSKVYASVGRFYEYIPLDLADRSLSGETEATYSTNPSACIDPKDPRTCAIIAGGRSGGRTYQFTGGGGNTGVDPNLKGQYTDEFQAGAQYQVYRDISIGVDYVRKQIGRVIEDMSADDGNSYFLSNPGEPGGIGYKAVTGAGQVVY